MTLEAWNNDVEAMVNSIMDRYGGSKGSAWQDQHSTDQKRYIDGWKRTVAYLPSVTDGDVWKVAVTVGVLLLDPPKASYSFQPGSELAVVVAIFNKVSALQIDGVDSAFYREEVPGVVYVEARNHDTVLAVLKGVNNVWLPRYHNRPIDLIPISERLALLTLDVTLVNEVEKAPDDQHRFVRIRDRTRYRNQLAVIGSYITEARHALVLVVPRELISVPGARRRCATRPALKRASPIDGEDYPSRPPLITSDGIDELQSVSSHGQYFSGLEVRRIDVDKLVYHDVHPTAHELDLFEATQHADICRLVSNARDLQIRQGEKFEVTQGPWKGFKGIAVGTMVTELDVLIQMKGQYFWEDVEVPTSDLLSTAPKGDVTTVKTGPYTGLTGRVRDYLADGMVVVSPDTGAEQSIDVRVSDIQRAVDLGDEVEIMLGTLRGHSGFYVGTDGTKARVYLPSTSTTHAAALAHGSMVSYRGFVNTTRLPEPKGQRTIPVDTNSTRCAEYTPHCSMERLRPRTFPTSIQYLEYSAFRSSVYR